MKLLTFRFGMEINVLNVISYAKLEVEISRVSIAGCVSFSCVLFSLFIWQIKT